MPMSIQKSFNEVLAREPHLQLNEIYARFPGVKPATLKKCWTRWRRASQKIQVDSDTKKVPPEDASPAGVKNIPELTTENLTKELWEQYQDSTGKAKENYMRMLVDVWKTKHTVPDESSNDDFQQLIEALNSDRLPEITQVAPPKQ
jgi:hypothetical protein